ncbi:hypothetical protein NLJ89_g7849 [Agrocybe chaxingu]|uniref:Histone-lysine N-methyltransferase, H3 lysine-4 specific n=1 Tax=Agrocybe chaxingu TaxID=84603 RepID=A0A9W8JTR7_9AGAR|nr:hypothetical protein NLJ89_g7849 [Agrocybe chaxingu]
MPFLDVLGLHPLGILRDPEIPLENRQDSRHSESRHPEPEPKKLYSLPPLPAWPPPRSEHPEGLRSFKVLYDPAVDNPLAASSGHIPQKYPVLLPPAHYRGLIDHIRKHGSPSVVQERIRGKGKGKESLLRFEGEVMSVIDPDDGTREEEVVVKDPRRNKDKEFRPPSSFRVPRNDLIEVRYEYDENSTGPPPPTSILLTGVSPFTSNTNLRRHFSQFGTVLSFEPQIDKENGSALGIFSIKFQLHEEAKRCLEKENGKRGGLGVGMPLKLGEVEEWRVVYDGDGSRLKAIMKELDERRKRDREDKRRSNLPNGISSATPSSHSVGGNAGTPLSGISSPAPRKGPLPPTQGRGGPRGQDGHDHRRPHGQPSSSKPHALPAKPIVVPVKEVDKVAEKLARARADAQQRTTTKRAMMQSSSRGRNVLQNKYAAYKASPMNISRSPSPSSDRKPMAAAQHKSAADREKERLGVTQALAKNGHEHVKVQGSAQLVASVSDDAVKAFFEGFAVDKVLRDHTGIYVTFTTSGVAHRATTVLGTKQLGFQSVTLSAHSAPAYKEVSEKTHWTETELVAEARKLILEELKGLLEKDISERVVGQDLKKLIMEEKIKGASAVQQEDKPLEKKGLKGLSFKRKKEEVVLVEQEPEKEKEEAAEDEEQEGEPEVEVEVERPKKRRKTEVVAKKSRRVINDEDLESEEEDEADTARLAAIESEAALKRAVSEDRDEEEEPVKKKQKIQEIVPAKGKKATKKAKKEVESVDQVILGESESFESPVVAQLRLGATTDSSRTPSRSPSPLPVRGPQRRKREPTPRLPTPPPDPVALGLCEDDEDLYYAKLALSGEVPEEEKPQAPPSTSDIPTFRKHLTGSARTEGYYKITHAEKAAYVAQYQARAANTGVPPPIVDEPQPQHVTSSRSNRANARRRAQGLEEINQVQRAVALSKGETAANELTFKFNQLQTRKKHLRFARSPIHDWGLYAMEKISRGEMVIEYVGEIIRAQVAEKREKAYERQGIGSSYLFRIDEDLVVDATKKGNLGRLINHSCDPNCTAKIITISGEKKIVIYAKQEIELGDEITYDYHFPFEQDKIPCLCGSAKCRGFLN